MGLAAAIGPAAAQAPGTAGHFLVPTGQELELVPGNNATLDSRFFEQIQDFSFGHRLRSVASGVGRFEILFDGETEWRQRHCTASLISEDYILTANHCVTSTRPPFDNLPLAGGRIRLGFLSDADPGVVWQVDPIPVADNFSPVPDLDYAVLRIIADDSLGPPTARFEPVKLFPFDPEPGKELFVIHHPDGQNQRLTARECRVVALSDDDTPVANTIPHRCDTRGGSSGAPVFSEELQVVVALHHAGINRIQTNFAKRLTAIAEHSEIIASLALTDRPSTQEEVKVQRDQAIDQAAPAVIDTLEQLVDRFNDRQGVTAEEIRDAIQIAEARIDELENLFGDTPIVRYTQAQVLVRISSAALVLGNAVDALATADEAVSIYSVLVPEVEKNSDIVGEWLQSGRFGNAINSAGTALMFRSRALAVLGRYDEAIENIGIALELSKLLNQEIPDVPHFRQTQMDIYSDLGDIHIQTGNRPEAIEAWTAGLTLARLALEENPLDLVAKRTASAFLTGLEIVHNELGNDQLAQAAREESLRISRELTAAQPDNKLDLVNLGISHQASGEELEDRGDLAGALQEYQAAIDIIEPIATGDPSDKRLQRVWASALEAIGGAYFLQGNLSDALRDYQLSLAIRQDLARLAPLSFDANQLVVFSLLHVGDTLFAQEQYNEALTLFEQAVDLASALGANNPSNPEARYLLPVAENGLGNSYRRLGQLQQALAVFQTRQANAQTLVADFPSQPDHQRELAHTHITLAATHEDMGDESRAAIAYDNALRLLIEMSEQDRDNLELHAETGLVSLIYGDLLRDQRRSDDAVAVWRDGLNVVDRFLGQEPTNIAQLTRRLTLSVRIGRMAGSTLSQQSRNTALREALTTARRLAELEPQQQRWRQVVAELENQLQIPRQNRNNENRGGPRGKPRK